MRSGCTLAATCLASMIVAQSAVANEMFVCPDKTLVRIDAKQRAQQYEHPCAKAWLGSNGGQPAPDGAPAAEARPDSGFNEAVRMTRAGIRR